jgi:hypothetical protein
MRRMVNWNRGRRIFAGLTSVLAGREGLKATDSVRPIRFCGVDLRNRLTFSVWQWGGQGHSPMS